jgi:hypothetical protein
MIELTSSTNYFKDESEILEENKLSYLKSVIKKNIYEKNVKNNIWLEFYNFIMDNNIFKKNIHIYRYLVTFNLMLENLDFKKIQNLSIVETGTPSPILFFLFKKGAKCYFTDSDLRKNINCDTDFADILLSFEVIEHLKDVPEKNFDEIVLFNQSGIKNYINEVKRVVKDNGQIYLTSPNPCSLRSLLLILNDEAPSIYRSHVREYSKNEIIDLFNLKTIKYESNNCFFNLDMRDVEDRIKNYFKLLKNPGDNHFFLFKNINKNQN